MYSLGCGLSGLYRDVCAYSCCRCLASAEGFCLFLEFPCAQMRFATLGRSRGEAAASCEREPERAHGKGVVVQKVCTAPASPSCAMAAGYPSLFVNRHGPPALMVASCVVGHSGYGAPHAAIVCARQTGNNACKRTPAGIIHRFPERRTIVLASCVRPTSSPPLPLLPLSLSDVTCTCSSCAHSRPRRRLLAVAKSAYRVARSVVERSLQNRGKERLRRPWCCARRCSTSWQALPPIVMTYPALSCLTAASLRDSNRRKGTEFSASASASASAAGV